MALVRRRSLSSTGRNRIQPVTVGPGPVSGQADLTGCADIGPGQITLPLAVEERVHQTRGSALNNTVGRRSRWSLKSGLSFLRKSSLSKKTPSQSVKKNRSFSILTSLSTSRAKRSSSNLKRSASTCTPKMSSRHSTKLDLGSSIHGGGIKGALGLTPLTAMFQMQTISSINTETKENQSSTKCKKFIKSGAKTPARSLSRRRILGILNRKEGNCTSDASFLNNLSFGKEQGTKGYFTRSKSKSSLDFDHGERLNQTVDNVTNLDDTKLSHVSSLRMTVSKVSSRSVPDLPTLSHEPSPGNHSIDLSLETSIMNTLYPKGSMSTQDLSSSDNSPLLMNTLQGKASRRQSISNTKLTAGSSHSQSQIRPRSNSYSASRLSQNINSADAFRVLVERLTEHEGLPADSPQESQPSRTKPLMVVNRSYVKVRPLADPSDSPVGRKRKQGVRFGEESVICQPKKVRRKSLGAAEGVSLRQKRHAVRPLTRSRSLRVWRQKESVEVTGQAGHTPLPRRRRPTSYNERLIM